MALSRFLPRPLSSQQLRDALSSPGPLQGMNGVERGEGTCLTSHSRSAAERKSGVRPLSPACGSIHHTQHKFHLTEIAEAHGKMLDISVTRETQRQTTSLHPVLWQKSQGGATIQGGPTGWPGTETLKRPSSRGCGRHRWTCLVVSLDVPRPPPFCLHPFDGQVFLGPTCANDGSWDRVMNKKGSTVSYDTD